MKLSNPWPGRGWPLSAEEEETFLLDVKAAPKVKSSCDEDEIAKGVTRGHVTLLVTALRQGSCVTEMLQVTPGLDPAALARAYRHVDKLLGTSLKAWEQLAANPSAERISRHGGDAAKLLPVTVAKLRAAVVSGRDPEVVLATESSRIVVLRRHYDQLADQLSRCADEEQRAAMARQMYHPDEDCLMQHPRFLPARVGELSPLRLARLLGEQQAGDEAGHDPEPSRPSNPSVAAARARPGRGRR